MSDRENVLQTIGELVERGAFRQALKVCDDALAHHASCAEFHDYRGLILCRLGRQAEALPCYDRAIHLDPELLPALLDKAELLAYYLGESEGAIALTDRVIRLGSHELDQAHAHYLKGIAYANLELHSEALACFDRSIALDPEYADAHCEKGVSLYESYQMSAALHALKTAFDCDAAYARPHHYLACIYEFMGERQLAEREYREAMRLDPDAHPVPVLLADEDFRRAVQEALNTLPREVARLLPRLRISVESLPDRCALADGLVRPSVLALRGRPDGAGSTPLVLYQRNLERAVRSRAELVEEIAHAVAHELGHPERA
jgi:tetratricopeptide (TPR) repeat protein